MTIIEQINVISEALKPVMADMGGAVKAASDPGNVLDLLSVKPGSSIAVVVCSGEEKSGDYEEAGWVDRRFSVIMTCGKRGVDASLSRISTRTSDVPFYDMIERVRDCLRGIEWNDETVSGMTNYQGWKPYEIEGQKLFDSIQLDFNINTACPDVSNE